MARTLLPRENSTNSSVKPAVETPTLGFEFSCWQVAHTLLLVNDQPEPWGC